jgi:hypothetical protein
MIFRPVLREGTVLGAALAACGCPAPGARAEAFFGLSVLCTVFVDREVG